MVSQVFVGIEGCEVFETEVAGNLRLGRVVLFHSWVVVEGSVVRVEVFGAKLRGRSYIGKMPGSDGWCRMPAGAPSMHHSGASDSGSLEEVLQEPIKWPSILVSGVWLIGSTWLVCSHITALTAATASGGGLASVEVEPIRAHVL